MRIIVKGKNLEITPDLRNYAEKKVGKLSRFFEGRPEILAEVMMRIEKEQDIVEITVQVDGILLRGEEKNEDLYASIDGAVEKIERQVRKHKTRLQNRFRNGPKLSELQSMEVHPDREKDTPRVVRTKRFAIKPMGVEEAIMQMDLLGHDFFVFTNAATNEINVVYRRKDGDYGLIEPNTNDDPEK